MTPTTEERTSDAIDIWLGPGDDIAESVGGVALRLSAPIRIRSSRSDRPSIGDIELPVAPERWRIEASLLRALGPRHVLFLCVANSARSQLAEGLARSLAPEGVRISSAGSAPTSVRPQAIGVLDEVGIDISGHRSIGIDDVERPVDAVITLCAEEVCPVWLVDAWRLHWALPDPAAVEGTEEQKLDAFREVRDELVKRLTVLLAPRARGGGAEPAPLGLSPILL